MTIKTTDSSTGSSTVSHMMLLVLDRCGLRVYQEVVFNGNTRIPCRVLYSNAALLCPKYSVVLLYRLVDAGIVVGVQQPCYFWSVRFSLFTTVMMLMLMKLVVHTVHGVPLRDFVRLILPLPAYAVRPSHNK